MRRLLRWLIRCATIASFLLCVLVLMLWAKSYRSDFWLKDRTVWTAGGKVRRLEWSPKVPYVARIDWQLDSLAGRVRWRRWSIYVRPGAVLLPNPEDGLGYKLTVYRGPLAQAWESGPQEAKRAVADAEHKIRDDGGWVRGGFAYASYPDPDVESAAADCRIREGIVPYWMAVVLLSLLPSLRLLRSWRVAWRVTKRLCRRGQRESASDRRARRGAVAATVGKTTRAFARRAANITAVLLTAASLGMAALWLRGDRDTDCFWEADRSRAAAVFISKGWLWVYRAGGWPAGARWDAASKPPFGLPTFAPARGDYGSPATPPSESTFPGVRLIRGSGWIRQPSGRAEPRTAPAPVLGVGVSWVWLSGLAAVFPVLWVVVSWRRRARWARGLCPVCGYDLRATPEKGRALLDRCPECGAVSPKAAAPEEMTTDP